MKLTRNFQLSEFAVSSYHPELATKIEFTESDKLKAYYLCAIHLQPLRDLYGPIKITSGKRSPELNKKVGGSETSDHLYKGNSAAVDFTTLQFPNIEAVFNNYVQRIPMSTYGQMILYRKSKFIHLSLPTEKHAGESWAEDK